MNGQKLFELVEELVEAEVAHSWVGSRPVEDMDKIRMRVEKARLEWKNFVNENRTDF